MTPLVLGRSSFARGRAHGYHMYPDVPVLMRRAPRHRPALGLSGTAGHAEPTAGTLSISADCTRHGVWSCADDSPSVDWILRALHGRVVCGAGSLGS